MSAKKRKSGSKSEISSPAISPPEQLEEDAPEQLEEDASEQSDGSARFEDFTSVPEPPDEDTVIANYAIEMAMHYYVSRLLKPLFPLIRDIFRGKPASIEEIIDVMEKTSVGERNLRDQIKIMLPKGADTLSLTRRE